MAEKEAWNDGLRAFIGLILLDLYGVIIGYFLVFCVFSYFHIDIPIPDIAAHGTGRSAVTLAFFANLPLLTFHFWNFSRIDFVKANPKIKWISVPLALAFLIAITTKRYAGMSQIGFILGLSLVSLLLSRYLTWRFRLNKWAIWVVILLNALIFLSSDLNALTSSRESFAINEYSNMTYAEIMCVGENHYLLQCEIIEKDGDTILSLKSKEVLVINKTKGENNLVPSEYGVFKLTNQHYHIVN